MSKKNPNSINDLILFVLYSSDEEDLEFEKLAKRCFDNFPESFSLQGYPKMLDTRKLDRPLRALRGEGFIKGSPKGYSVTKKGEKEGKEIAKELRQQKLL